MTALQEIGSRLVLPGLVVSEHCRSGNGVGVIRNQEIASSCYRHDTVRTQVQGCPCYYLFTAEVFEGFLARRAWNVTDP